MAGRTYHRFLVPLLFAAQASVHPATAAQPEIQLPVTVVDLPADLQGFPSMDQSLDISYDIDRLAMLGVHQLFESLFPDNLGVRRGVGLGVAYGIQPLLYLTTGVFVHEEWHRAVLSAHGVSSIDGLYTLNGANYGVIQVYDVSDAELDALRSESPPDHVRLSAAGIEATTALDRRIGLESFLHGGEGWTAGPVWSADSWTAPLLSFDLVGDFIYLSRCASPSDPKLAELELLQDTEASRDFTGLDCTAWAWDLTHPDADFADRGQHPTGVGVDRYRFWEDLDEEGRSMLTLNRWLVLTGLLNPHLYGVNGFLLADGTGRWVASARHWLTAYGYAVDVEADLKWKELGWSATLRNGFNRKRWWPALEVAAYDIPLGPLWSELAIEGWQQPAELRWDDATGRLGGRIEARVGSPVQRHLRAWVGVEAKSVGWTPGNVATDADLSGRAGLTVSMR